LSGVIRTRVSIRLSRGIATVRLCTQACLRQPSQSSFAMAWKFLSRAQLKKLSRLQRISQLSRRCTGRKLQSLCVQRIELQAFYSKARSMRDLLNCWVTTSVRVLRTSGLWEVAATIALSADAGAGTISNIFWSSSREDVSVNDFCIVEGASVCLLATRCSFC